MRVCVCVEGSIHGSFGDLDDISRSKWHQKDEPENCLKFFAVTLYFIKFKIGLIVTFLLTVGMYSHALSEFKILLSVEDDM